MFLCVLKNFSVSVLFVLFLDIILRGYKLYNYCLFNCIEILNCIS